MRSVIAGATPAVACCQAICPQPARTPPHVCLVTTEVRADAAPHRTGPDRTEVPRCGDRLRPIGQVYVVWPHGGRPLHKPVRLGRAPHIACRKCVNHIIMFSQNAFTGYLQAY
jgi:hypothetical protein